MELSDEMKITDSVQVMMESEEEFIRRRIKESPLHTILNKASEAHANNEIRNPESGNDSGKS